MKADILIMWFPSGFRSHGRRRHSGCKLQHLNIVSRLAVHLAGRVSHRQATGMLVNPGGRVSRMEWLQAAAVCQAASLWFSAIMCLFASNTRWGCRCKVVGWFTACLPCLTRVLGKTPRPLGCLVNRCNGAHGGVQSNNLLCQMEQIWNLLEPTRPSGE